MNQNLHPKMSSIQPQNLSSHTIDMQTLINHLILSNTPGLGIQSALKLIEHFGSVNNIFLQDSRVLGQFLKPTIVNLLFQKDNTIPMRELEWMQAKSNRHIIYLGHPLYPEELTNISVPPLVLYLEGNIKLLQNPKFAIVGTRNPSPQGRENAYKFANELGQSGFTIVSGVANGIDRYAHLGSFNNPAATIGVIGTGIGNDYPTANKDIYAKMREAALLVSEFPQGTMPLPSNFPRRNRIIAGLSIGCLVVESTLDGGSMITANYALEMGREVMAIPGSINSPYSKGCHKLIKNGAKLVENTNDILEDLNVNLNSFDTIANAKTNDPILDSMGFEPIDIDTICTNAKIDLSDACAKLLLLELEGVIINCGGGKYQRIFK